MQTSVKSAAVPPPARIKPTMVFKAPEKLEQKVEIKKAPSSPKIIGESPIDCTLGEVIKCNADQ